MNPTSSLDAVTRYALLAAGLVLFAVGVVTHVLVEPLVGILPSSFLLPALIGALALLSGLWTVRQWNGGTDHQSAVPDVELPISTLPPGSDIDEALYRLTRYRENTVEYRNQIQERLTSVAIDIIRKRDGCSRERAIHKLKEGTWTDSAYAAAFFAGGSPPSKPTFESLRDRLHGEHESDYERWVRMTVDTLVERAGTDVGIPDDPEEEEDGSLLERLRNRYGNAEGETTRSAAHYDDVTTDSGAEMVSEGVVYGDLLHTGRWNGITALALVAAGWGILTTSPPILLVTVVGVAFTAYARSRMEPDLTSLDVTRHVSETTPEPGEEVDITVTVENKSGSYLPDLRLVDRVPPSMTVVQGSPRVATALSSGSRVTFTYTVVAERGIHEWPLLVMARDFSGSIEREAAIAADAGIECVPQLTYTQNAPVRSQTSLFSGQVDTSIGGSGLEFFSVREYREGDPMNRIDWKRRARTGEFATIDFRQEKAAKVVLMFDARESAYVSHRPGARHAVDRSVDAAMELFAALFGRGDLVGIAAFDTIPCWLAPSAGDDHRERARRLFSGHEAIASVPPALKDAGGEYIDPMTHIRRQLDPDSQVLLFSPLADDYTAEVARRLDSMGYPITVVSPNPSATESIGQRLAGLERSMRITNLREHGIRIVDWEPEDRLGVELDRAKQRWTV